MTTADPATTVPEEDERDLPRGLLGAGIAVTAWSTGTILAKHIDMDALAIGFYRFSVFFVGIVLFMRARNVRFSWRMFRASTWGGVALGADIVLFFSAVKATSIVNATVIGSLQPIVVGIVAARFFGEKIRGRDALWALVALAGALIVVRSGANDDVTSLRGDLLAAGAMFAWSAYFIASKESRRTLTSTEFTAGTSIWTGLICLAVGLLIGQDMALPNASNWGWLALMIVGSGIVGHALMNWSLQRIPLWVGSTFTLFIPVASALLAWALLGEAITWPQAVAIVIVVGALAMIVRGQTKMPVVVLGTDAPSNAPTASAT